MKSEISQNSISGAMAHALLGLLSAASIETYIHTVIGIPVLAADEEKRLARLVRDERNSSAAQTLILSNLRFVVFVARRYLGYGLPLSDLIQEGNVGLITALKRFDPERGCRLISFAVHWIKAEIHEFVIKNWRIVKLATTKAKRKLFFNIRKYSQHSGRMTKTEAEAVAIDLNVTIKEVLEMEGHMSSGDMSINTPGEVQLRGCIPEYLLPSAANEYQQIEDADWIAHSHKKLAEGLKTLDARSLDIIQRRWIQDQKPTRLEDLAAEYKVSAERIRQIQDSALHKLRLYIEEDVVATG